MSADKKQLKPSLSEQDEILASEELSASEKQNDSAIDPMEMISSDDELDMILASLNEGEQIQEPAPEKAETPKKKTQEQQSNNIPPIPPPKHPALTVKTKPSVFEKLCSTLHVGKSTEVDDDPFHEEKLEQERLEKERIKKAILAKEKLEQERLEQERFEKEKFEKEKLEKEKLEKEKLEKEKLEKEKLKKERLEKERLEKERLEKERLEKARLEKERLEKARLEKERLEKERLEKERLEKERLEKERLEKERLEKERLEKERLEKERLEKERLEKERLEKERLEKERLEKERLEKERLDQERLEQEKLQIQQKENAALEKERLMMERIGREQEKLRLEREKLKHERLHIKKQALEAKKLNNDKKSSPHDLAVKLNQALENQVEKPQKNFQIKKPDILSVTKKIKSILGSKKEKQNQLIDLLNQESMIPDIDDVMPDFEEESELSPESRGVVLFADEKLDDKSELEYFVPDKHMLSTFLHQLEIAKQTYQLIEVKFNGVLIIIDHTLNTVYCNKALDSKKFKECCSMLVRPEMFTIRELNYDEAKTHQSSRREKPELSHSIESFIWATSLHTSQGRAPENTDLSRIIGLKNKLKLKQLAVVPHLAEIIELLEEGSCSLANIQQQLGMRISNIFDVYSALLNLGLIEFNPASSQAKKQSASVLEDAPKKIFGRFFKRKGK